MIAEPPAGRQARSARRCSAYRKCCPVGLYARRRHDQAQPADGHGHRAAATSSSILAEDDSKIRLAEQTASPVDAAAIVHSVRGPAGPGAHADPRLERPGGAHHRAARHLRHRRARRWTSSPTGRTPTWWWPGSRPAHPHSSRSASRTATSAISTMSRERRNLLPLAMARSASSPRPWAAAAAFIDGDFGNAGGTGNAGSIAFDLTGSIQTLGDGSHGALLQSIGDGNAATSTMPARQCRDQRRRVDRDHRADDRRGRRLCRRRLHRRCGGGGNAGSIAFDLTGSVQTAGDGSHGMLLQTIGTTAGDVDYHARPATS